MRDRILLSLIFVILLLLTIEGNVFATSWAYPFVVWDEYIYVVSDEYVKEIDSKIGHVTSYSDMEAFSGNFSNTYKEGTGYFSIIEVSAKEAIAIEEENGKYRKAYREGKYAGGRYDSSNLLTVVVGTLVSLFVIALVIIFVRKKWETL